MECTLRALDPLLFDARTERVVSPLAVKGADNTVGVELLESSAGVAQRPKRKPGPGNNVGDGALYFPDDNAKS